MKRSMFFFGLKLALFALIGATAPTSSTTQHPLRHISEGNMFRTITQKALNGGLSIFIAIIIAFVSGALEISAAPKSTPVVRVTLAYNGAEPNGEWLSDVSTSPDGRYVVFESDSTNLVPNDVNGYRDIFVRDLVNGTIELVSVASDGSLGNGNSSSTSASISSDGRYVAFTSHATNLVENDTNGTPDVFVRDLQTRTTVRVSLTSNDSQANGSCSYASISGNGRYVVFNSMANNLDPIDTHIKNDIYLRDRDTDNDGIYDEPGSVSTFLVSKTVTGQMQNNQCVDGLISETGRFVTFVCNAGNMLPGGIYNLLTVYVYDRDTDADGIFDEVGYTSLVLGSASTTGGFPNDNSGNGDPAPISADGRYVVFGSLATNIVSGDTNGVRDIFVRDLVNGINYRVSVASDGTQGNGTSHSAWISSDGRFVAFDSNADNLVAGDTNGWGDIFLHDMVTSQTVRISLAYNDAEADEPCYAPVISKDGNVISYISYSSNLVEGDTNNKLDGFLYGNIPTPHYLTTYLPIVLKK